MQVNVGTSGAEIGAAFGGNKVRRRAAVAVAVADADGRARPEHRLVSPLLAGR